MDIEQQQLKSRIAKATEYSSRLPGFYELSLNERSELIQSIARLDNDEVRSLKNLGAISQELCDVFIENAVGSFSLPLGIATNFVINGKQVLVPMAVEETSVLAAASHGAKLARAGGGFTAEASEPIMTGQIQMKLLEKVDFDAILTANKDDLIKFANHGLDSLIERGGGVKNISWRYIEPIKYLVLHLDVDTREAMGANIVNTVCEKIAPLLVELLPVEMGLRILSNLSLKRMAKASCRIPHHAFDNGDMPGREVVRKIEEAYQFAAHDVFRATTHNKGVMNGADPVVTATGNDWRAVEAGAHAYASKDGCYMPLTKWFVAPDDSLVGTIEMPMAIGVVGGVTRLHPSAQTALKILGNPTAQELSEVIVSVGLAQNLSALRALSSEGIQRGHMALHHKNLELLRRQRAQHN